MKRFRTVINKRELLTWEGELHLKRGRDISEEEYSKYFQKESVSYEIVHSYMLRHPLDIFCRLPVWVLKYEYQQEIYESILSGNNKPLLEDCPTWVFEFNARDRVGNYRSFDCIEYNCKIKILNSFYASKDHRANGKAYCIDEYNYMVNISFPQPSENSDIFYGALVFEDDLDGGNYEYAYNIRDDKVRMTQLIDYEYSPCVKERNDVTDIFAKYNPDLINAIKKYCMETM